MGSVEVKVLKNNVKIPTVGLGVYKMKEGYETKESIKIALEKGYRHIDTAMLYGNEKSVGEAIKESNIKREEIFVCTKLWNTDRGYENTLKAFEDSRKNLGLDYIDLYLIHWPRPKEIENWEELNKDTWKAMEKLYEEGKIKAIGVANFEINHLKSLMRGAKILPMVNQIECHVELNQKELLEFCYKNNIIVEAWAPLMQGKVFEIELLKDLANKYNKTIAQIVLRWQNQRGVIVLPKSTHEDRIKGNIEIFDFIINDDDMNKINSININKRIGPHPHHAKF